MDGWTDDPCSSQGQGKRLESANNINNEADWAALSKAFGPIDHHPRNVTKVLYLRYLADHP